METTIESLPIDIFLIISANLVTLTDKLSCRQVNTNFRESVCFMEIKIIHMKNKIDMALFAYSRLPRRWGNCVNVDCEDGPDRMWRRRGWSEDQPTGLNHAYNAMSLTTFYYPKELIEPHDYEGDPYGPNYEYRYRDIACSTCSSVERYIPYCEMCMMEYVNFGMRDDDLEVPYRGSYGENNL